MWLVYLIACARPEPPAGFGEDCLGDSGVDPAACSDGLVCTPTTSAAEWWCTFACERDRDCPKGSDCREGWCDIRQLRR